MLLDQIRRSTKEKAVEAEIVHCFERSRDNMLQSFRGLSSARKLIELAELVKKLGELL